MINNVIAHEYKLDIKHYDGDQTVDEIHKPCNACLFRKDEQCLVFNAPTNQGIRSCVSNYRIDIETLVAMMQEKRKIDSAKYYDYLKSSMKKSDVIDIVGVHKELEKVLGE